VRNCLSDYRRKLEAAGVERTLAVATSAVRDAENGEAFLGEVEWSYGFTTRLLSGGEEAELTFAGVTAGRALPDGALVLDVGGGSTELVAGGPLGFDFHASVDLGCVRLTERFLRSDPPAPDELAACAGYVQAVLQERVPDQIRSEAQAVVGVAGTVTSLAALELDLVPYDPARIHGYRLRATAVDEQLAKLAALPVAERREVPTLEPQRAPVIVAGALIVREVLRHFGLDELEVSERDLLDGVALAAAELPEPVEGDAPPGAYTCC
jgi:exopolyphosphatase/guanosine-5'-triphosphate,3'-diphosphate pyrophosphatase